MPKRVLMVLTNHGTIEGTDKSTGWYLPEAAHPYARFHKAGYHIEFASIKGGACPVTPSSVDLNDQENREFWEGSGKGFTENTKVLSTVKPLDYDLIFFVGGFGTMWDFPFDPFLADAVKQVYEKGGLVGAVCHGPIALAHVILSDGHYLIEGKEVAGFTNEEEGLAGLQSYLPQHPNGLGNTIEDIFTKRGAKYTKGNAFTNHIAQSHRVFTGQNPQSAGAVGDAIVAAFSHQ